MELPCGVSKSTYAQDMAVIHTRPQWGLLGLLLAFLCVLPFFLNSLWLGMVTHTCIVLIAVLGLHILTGLCGQISLGQPAFLGVGAYASTLLCAGLHFPLLLIPEGAVLSPFRPKSFQTNGGTEWHFEQRRTGDVACPRRSVWSLYLSWLLPGW